MDSFVLSGSSHSFSVPLPCPLNITNFTVPPLSCNYITPSFNFSPISPSALVELLDLQETGHISSSVAKQVSQLHRPCNYPPLFVTQYKQPS